MDVVPDSSSITDEELICKGNEDEDDFDVVIGHIEETVITPEFNQMLDNFMEKHCNSFEDCEENKLEYMDIFNEYTELIENYIEKTLISRIPEFSMPKFLDQLGSKCEQEELDGEIFDTLLTFTDFIAFKNMILDYKAAKDGHTPDLSLKNVR